MFFLLAGTRIVCVCVFGCEFVKMHLPEKHIFDLTKKQNVNFSSGKSVRYAAVIQHSNEKSKVYEAQWLFLP